MRIMRSLKGKFFDNEIDPRAGYEQSIKEINEQNSAIGISLLPLRWEIVMKLQGEYIIYSLNIIIVAILIKQM